MNNTKDNDEKAASVRTPVEEGGAANPPSTAHILVSAMYMADKIYNQVRRAQDEQQQQQQQQQHRAQTISTITSSSSSSNTVPSSSRSSSSWTSLPGMVDGGLAGLGMVIATSLPRRRLLAMLPKALMVDGLYTVGQVLLSAQATLYVGSMRGSYQQLSRFVHVLETDNNNNNINNNNRNRSSSNNTQSVVSSPIADTVCRDPQIVQDIWRHLPHSLSTTSDTSSSKSSSSDDKASSSKSSSFVSYPSDWVIEEYRKCLEICRVRNQRQDEEQQRLRLLALQQQQQQQQTRPEINANLVEEVARGSESTKSSWFGFGGQGGREKK